METRARAGPMGHDAQQPGQCANQSRRERERGTAKLEEAVVAFREALKEWTREHRPRLWAAAHSNLGNALQALSDRESGTAKANEAIVAYREALKEHTRARDRSWAKIQSNLGNALVHLGTRESGTAKLEEAVVAFREVLEIQTRERVPLQWAAIQNNLGNALLVLGQRESGTAKLDEAVAAYREALKERTRERVPLDWAMGFGNEGVALMLLAERNGNAAMAETALSQINTAFETMRAIPSAMAAKRQGRRFTNNSFPEHALSSRGCAGGEVLHEAASVLYCSIGHLLLRVDQRCLCSGQGGYRSPLSNWPHSSGSMPTFRKRIRS